MSARSGIGPAGNGKTSGVPAEGGVGVASTTDISSRPAPRGSLNYAYPIRPGSQQQPRPPPRAHPSGSSRRPPPPLPGNAGSGQPPQRLPPRYVPPLTTDSTLAVEHVQQQQAAQSPFEDPAEAPFEWKPSGDSPEDIPIGFDPAGALSVPSRSTSSKTTSTSSGSTLGVIPNFPSPAEPEPRRPSASHSSDRRGASSHYSQSQRTLMVSPIPEERSRQTSYASSAAIPSSWGSEPPGYSQVPVHEAGMNEDVARDDVAHEGGAVRHASVGRKSRPTLTNIQSSGKGKGRSNSSTSSSDESIRMAAAGVAAGVLAAGGLSGTIASSAAVRKNSPQLLQSPTGSPLFIPHRSVKSMSGLTQQASADSPTVPSAAEQDYFTEKPYAAPLTSSIARKQEIPSALMKELEMARDSDQQTAEANFMPGSGTHSEKQPWSEVGKRRAPPKLDMGAVREAEARGSLTSLPDLIARATKLAAKLEHGRPESGMWGRNSFFGARSRRSEMWERRDTDSISDILGSFPRPALATPSRLGGDRKSHNMAAWPLPEEFNDGRDGNSRRKRICGLPVWAFIILVILALVVIAAAVIVPLQLVNLSKNQKSKSTSSVSDTLSACQKQLTCNNGGQNIATSSFCGCVCTNGFMGSNCTERQDTSCTSFNFGSQATSSTTGITNATIGSALPRLIEKAQGSYNVNLDPSIILAQFSKADISCTLQNALVNFLGNTEPTSGDKKRSANRRALVTEGSATSTAPSTSTASSSSASASSTRTPAIDQDAVDFGRVAVLYILQTESINNADTAQQNLNTAFKAGMDFGNVDAGNQNTIDLDNRSIRTPNGTTVGGVTVNGTTTNSSTASTSTASATSSSSVRRRLLLGDLFQND